MAFHTTVFDQLLSSLRQLDFDDIVSKHHTGAKPRKFDHWSQLVSMVFCQFTSASSIRDLMINFNARKKMHYHWRAKSLKKSTLADANHDRHYKPFEILFYKALGLHKKGMRKKVEKLTYIIDSTTIDLCLSLFPWAHFRKKKGAVKMHTLLDANTSIPECIVVTDGKKHDLKPGKYLASKTPKGSILLVDKAYIDFQWLSQLNMNSRFFVTRAKKNMSFKVVKDLLLESQSGVVSDQIIALSNDKYPETMRLVTFKDVVNGKVYHFMTNILNLDAKTISGLYKQRWEIELFFKWIKQNLKIKKFLGRSKNSVLIQIYTALLVYIMTAYIRKFSKTKFSFLQTYRVIKANLFERSNILELLNPKPEPPQEAERERLPLLNFCTGQ